MDITNESNRPPKTLAESIIGDSVNLFNEKTNHYDRNYTMENNVI